MSETSVSVDYFINDGHFDNLFPKHIQQLSGKHWTPLQVAGLAAGFLAAEPGCKILDIGSGNGKFCLAAGHYRPHCHFYGIEQRMNLVQLANKAKKSTSLENVTFIHGNLTELDLNDFDHFYFYNSFYENLVDDEYHIDENVIHSVRLYEYYTEYLLEALNKRPTGTKLVTYHNYREIIPPQYNLVTSVYDGILRCWIKV